MRGNGDVQFCEHSRRLALARNDDLWVGRVDRGLDILMLGSHEGTRRA